MGKIIINVDFTDNFVAAPATEDIACVSTGRTLDEVISAIRSRGLQPVLNDYVYI